MKNALLIFCLATAAFAQGRLTTGTSIQVRLNDTIDSSKATRGQTFSASVAEDISVNDRVLVPRGANATVKLVDLNHSGKFKGKAEMGVVLTQLRVNGRDIAVETGEVTKVSGSQGKNTALKTGIGAGIGAAIGAIAGGGRGAAIGAGAGGAAGAGSQVFTKGETVKIPVESVLTFVLTKEARTARN